MAEPLELIDNKNRVPQETSFYRYIESNLLEILRRGFEDNEELDGHMIVHYFDYDPKNVNVNANELPALFVWSDGSTGGPKVIGQHRGMQSHTDYEVYYLNIMYVDSKIDRREANYTCKDIAEAVREQIVTNLNVNDIGVSYGEFIECTFFPLFLTVDDVFCPVHNFSMKMEYGRLSSKVTSRRRT